MAETKDILLSRKLRFTSNRAEILQLFVKNHSALSQPEIERELQGVCDRVTIYRTLNTFIEKGILHKVLDDEGAMKYALCTHDCDADGAHSHDHVHFKCSVCGNTECLEDIHIRIPALPDGYDLHEISVLLQGICSSCKHVVEQE